MASLNGIFKKLEEQFGITISGSRRNGVSVNGVQFFSPSMKGNAENGSVLLIRQDSQTTDTAVSEKYTGDYPLLVTACPGGGEGENIYTCKEAPPLYELFNAVQNIFLESDRLQHCKDELFNQLTEENHLKPFSTPPTPTSAIP